MIESLGAPERVKPAPQDLAKIKSIHLIAICGTGMGSLAGLLKARGYDVSGSDQNVYPPMSTQLENLGIAIQSGWDAARLKNKDLVVVGNAISRGNAELEAALTEKKPLLSLPEALNYFFLAAAEPIVVTGTHGKTTTSAIATYLLDQSGLAPGFFVGGVLANYESSFGLGKVRPGMPFVVEGDEYDTACFDKRPKFLHFRPHAAILTSIEFDHADIYRDLAHVTESFRQFVRQMPRQSLLVANGEDPVIESILPDCAAKIIRYGLNDRFDFSGRILQESAGIEFELLQNQKSLGVFKTPLMGAYNLKNLLAVLAVLDFMGVAPARALQNLKNFKSVLRRQEIRGVERGVTVIDDFAHHPTAVRETLKALKAAYAGQRIWILFEPRTATSRRKVFQKDYAESFRGADEVIIAGAFNLQAIQEDNRFSPQQLVEDLNRGGVKARYIETVDAIVKLVAAEARSGDVIGIFSNGGFGGIHDKLLATLKLGVGGPLSGTH